MAVQTTRIRNRAKNPSVANGPVWPKMRDLVEFSFAEGLAQQFAYILKTDGKVLEAAMASLTELARSYLTWKKAPISSREIVRSELLQIAQLETEDRLQAPQLRTWIFDNASPQTCASFALKKDGARRSSRIRPTSTEPTSAILREQRATRRLRLSIGLRLPLVCRPGNWSTRFAGLWTIAWIAQRSN